MPATAQLRESRKLGTFFWYVLTLFAISTGTGALRYALPHIPFPAQLPNLTTRHWWLVTHAACSSIALLAGPWQFRADLRARHLKLHRWTGRVYCIAVAIGWFASVPIAAHAQTGIIASTGFLFLGFFWIITTAAAYFTIRAGRVRAHREWMIRSYALTAAAITLRIYLPLCLVNHISFDVAYPPIAWLCWIPNLLLAEWLILRNRRPPRIAAL